jgi:hypothetical protein
LEPLDEGVSVVGVGDVAGNRLNPLATVVRQLVEAVTASGGR